MTPTDIEAKLFNHLAVQTNLIPYAVSHLGTGVGLCPSTIQR